ncbi:MAG: amidohydrolase family protein [Aestuariivirga sp.]
MIIDAHHHFWNPARGDYFWMVGEVVAPIAKVIGPKDIAPHLANAGIAKTVLVQAAPTIAETEYMLGLADATDYVAKVVGWVDFENAQDLKQLQRLAKHPKFSGVRPMIQDLPDPEWMHRKDVRWAFDAIIDLELSFDALGFPLHLDPFLRLFQRYPKMRTVIDHCMKPAIRDGAFEPWASKMAMIAKETNVFCKLSGIATEAKPGWDVEILRPYATHVLNSFGPQRVMWGSDWPVLNLNGNYEQWFLAAKSFVPAVEQGAVFGETAAQFYRII